uniref:Uncharacterized protein n=1 Tax=Chromera velia CCMP2878 TaxID=1169474 RepID=A0A0G4GVB2_9ALVE|eukprot:Cvel_23531.t1-p1 / transcript=Cvel_23531.t1 / gene=Cvel_23531 / organism=Chromera_velia_CCMP2878 / gene_product=hypothetical protein / transcript_product=hypothetical protein / location=Cvel_scaffold2435:23292-23825(-) / protein_length=178 / sequence_SO=supercontig / SO=protein_coding / is_pseudo=false
MQDVFYALGWVLLWAQCTNPTLLKTLNEPPFDRHIVNPEELFDTVITGFKGDRPPDESQIPQKTAEFRRSTAITQVGNQTIKAIAGLYGALLGKENSWIDAVDVTVGCQVSLSRGDASTNRRNTAEAVEREIRLKLKPFFSVYITICKTYFGKWKVHMPHKSTLTLKATMEYMVGMSS